MMQRLDIRSLRLSYTESVTSPGSLDGSVDQPSITTPSRRTHDAVRRVRRPTRPHRAVGAGALAVAVALSACSGGGESSDTTPSTSTTVAPTTTVRVDDGQFVVGLVVPETGPAAEIGAAVTAAVQLAVEQVNEAGGVNGQTVRVETRDEGDNSALAQVAVQDLVQAGADVIIGPMSSPDTLATLGITVDSSVLTCSPTASALALDDYPDDGLFFRTVPSDSLQARGIAEIVDDAGGASTALVYLDDPYGRPFAEAVQQALASKGVTVTASAGVAGDEESLLAAADVVDAADADVVVVIADAATGSALISAIDDNVVYPRPTFVVNDALRRPEVVGQPFEPRLGDRIVGISPLAIADDAAFVEELRSIDLSATRAYAHSGYDCMALIALAARDAQSTNSIAIGAALNRMSNGGSSCRSYPVCLALYDAGRNIDYDGPSGEMSIGQTGDLTTAVFEQFAFVDGRDVTVRTFVVGSD